MEEDLIQFIQNRDSNSFRDSEYYDQLRTKINEYIDSHLDDKLKNYALKNHSHGKPSSLQRFG